MSILKDTYSIQTAEYIRNLIRQGKLLPGDSIKESLIAETLHISRAPVREALLLLDKQGLVSSKPQKGKSVRIFSEREILDSYAVAGILEGAGVSMSFSLWGEREYADFNRAASRIENLKGTESPEALAEIDNGFHDILLAACDNAYLIKLARESCTMLSKYLYYKLWCTLRTPEKYRQDHAAVIEAIRHGKPVEIEKALRAHYADLGTRLSHLVYPKG